MFYLSILWLESLNWAYNFCKFLFHFKTKLCLEKKGSSSICIICVIYIYMRDFFFLRKTIYVVFGSSYASTINNSIWPIGEPPGHFIEMNLSCHFYEKEAKILKWDSKRPVFPVNFIWHWIDALENMSMMKKLYLKATPNFSFISVSFLHLNMRQIIEYLF